MDVVIVNQQEVTELLPMRDCMAVMADVLGDLASGGCQLPLRQIMWLEDRRGALGLMPSYWQSAGVIGLKAVTFFPGNEGSELDSHQGAVLLYEAERGRLLAMVDATAITAIRTAAVSGVATRLLAREDAAELALVGCGVQARTHLEAMLLSRSIERVRVCGKTLEHAESFAERESRRHGMAIEAVRCPRDAVKNADIICTVTSSSEPVVHGEWLQPGTHLNAVGSSVPFARELDGTAMRRSRLFVDRRESALKEAGDFLLAKKEGAVGDGDILAEIGDIIVGRASGRASPDEVTLFKSVGLAVEDLASAWHVYQKAMQTGAGSRVAFGGERHEGH